MYRSYIPVSLTTVELRIKNKDLPENVKWCNGLCQDIRECSEFSPNKHICKNCINSLNIAIKKVECNDITIEQFKQNPKCILDGNKDDDNTVLKKCVVCKEEKGASHFEEKRARCKACRAIENSTRNSKDIDTYIATIEKLKNKIPELKHIVAGIPKDKLIKVISHFKIGRKSTDSKDKMVLNIVNHFKAQQNPYACVKGCGVTLTVQFNTCGTCKKKKKVSKLERDNDFVDTKLKDITLDNFPMIDNTNEYLYTRNHIGLIAKKFGLTVSQSDKKEKVVEMINALLEHHKKEALKNRMEESEKVEEEEDEEVDEAEEVEEEDEESEEDVKDKEENKEEDEEVEVVKEEDEKKETTIVVQSTEKVFELQLPGNSKISIPIREDGMINATLLCKIGKTRFAKYTKNKQTQDFLNLLSSSEKLSIDKLIYMKKGRLDQSTWVHRKVALHLVQWIFPNFLIKVVNFSDIKIELYQTKLKEKDNVIMKLSSEKKENSKQLEIEKEKSQEAENKLKMLLYKRSYHKFKKGPVFYIISDLDASTKKYKVGIDHVDINIRLQQHRTSIPSTKLNFLVYTDKNSLIEKVILTKFEKCRKNHLNHEWIIDVDLEVLISSVKSIIDFSNLDVTYEDDIESYNKDIELEYKK
jgi:hypothetical protein